MKIKVLQGLNLQNSQTTVVAEMKSVKPDLIDFFKEMHPIFMKDYEILDGKTLKVKTNLPSLWKNQTFLQPVEEYSMGTIDIDKAKEQMLEVASAQIYSMSTIPILQAAHKMGYETIQAFLNKGILPKNRLNRHYIIGIGKEAAQCVSASTTGDSSFSIKTQRDKIRSNQFIEGMDLPIAPWTQVESREEIPEACETVGFPLVIKPVGLTAGHGVYVGLDTVKEMEEAWDKIQEYYANMEFPKSGWQKKILIQRKVEGQDYRVLVVNGKVEIATHRIPARVTGDGKHTIQELIEIENKDPRRNISLPTHVMKYIVIDDDLIDIVRKNGHELDDVPEKDEIVYVRKVASMSQGGITADVTDKMNPQSKLICESIAKSIHANVLGVDLLVKDISKPLTLDNGSILEMNTMPEIYLNAFPIIGKQYPDIGEKILAGAMDPTIHTNRVVAVGKIDRKTLEEKTQELFDNQEKIGLMYEKTIFINGYEINCGISIESAVLSLKKNRSLDTIVLHYNSVQEIEDNGFGFNNIDVLIVTKEESEQIKNTTDKYSAEKKIRKVVIL
ncbi:ATP-grasp domain-containing protein [Candidatus Dojkabacteria bacterium]|nr:ATP-grasp domain-containing protein [Candidatus Dojkabacteria bacterium]